LKKSLIESRIIRFYVLLWTVFVIGMLIAFALDQAQKPLKDLVLPSFILSAGSLIITVPLIFPVQEEIRARYPQAINGEKVFLTGLFYFARGFFLLVGTLILMATLNRKDVLAKDLAEVGGKISRIEVSGGDNSFLTIMLENNANEYKTRIFKIPDKNLEQIQNELQPGDFVFVLIERKDKNALNDLSIQIYGVRTTDYNYLTLAEFNRADAVNNSFGILLGMFLAVPGIIYLLTARIRQKPGQVMSIDQNASKA
jgi:hypothetical protein